MHMTPYRLAWIATAIACVGSVAQFIAPVWVFVTVLIVSLSVSAVSMVWARRRLKRFQLELKMAQAFGPGPIEYSKG